MFRDAMVAPRGNALNGRPEMDVLPGILLELMDHRAFAHDLSRVGIFNPAGQSGMHHRQTLLIG